MAMVVGRLWWPVQATAKLAKSLLEMIFWVFGLLPSI